MIPKKCVIFVSEEKDVFKNYEILTEEEAGKCNSVVISTKGEGGILSDDSITRDKLLSVSQEEVSNILDLWLKTGDCCSPPEKQVNWSSRIFA